MIGTRTMGIRILAVGAWVLGVLFLPGLSGSGEALAAQADGPPPFSVGEQPLNLGYILLGERFTTTIELMNEGDEPFTIQKISSGCVCTSVEAMDQVVPAHGSTTLVLDHDPYPYVHGWTKSIRIQTVERPRQWYTIVVRAMCGYAVQLNRGASQWVLRPSGNITASSIDGQPFRILSVHGKTPVLLDFDPVTDEPRNEYIIQYDLGQAAKDGTFGFALVIETDHPDAQMVALRIGEKSMRRGYASDPPSWRSFDEYVLAGPMPMNGPWVERTITLKRTRTPEGELPQLDVEMISTAPGVPANLEAELVKVVSPEDVPRGEFDVTVRFRARQGAQAGFTEEILMISRGPQFTQVPVYGRVLDATDGASSN